MIIHLSVLLHEKHVFTRLLGSAACVKNLTQGLEDLGKLLFLIAKFFVFKKAAMNRSSSP